MLMYKTGGKGRRARRELSASVSVKENVGNMS